jgi:hypothetical protein
MIPDPAREDEIRQAEWDAYADALPVCVLCNRRLYPGDRFHTTRCKTVCTYCLHDLEDNGDLVEVGR